MKLSVVVRHRERRGGGEGIWLVALECRFPPIERGCEVDGRLWTWVNAAAEDGAEGAWSCHCLRSVGDMT